MERAIKFFSLSILLITVQNAVFAEPAMSLSTLVTPQIVSFDDCTKTFNMNCERLFYLTLASINANRFEIKEIQSKTGYILFSDRNAHERRFVCDIFQE